MFGGAVEYMCDPPVVGFDPPYMVEQQVCNPVLPVMPTPIIEPVYEPCYDAGYADPVLVDPYVMDPYAMDPYAMDPYAMDPYAMDPYAMDPYAGYGMDPYGYYDALHGMGYFGPWPKSYYDRPRQEDSDSDDDDCCRQRRRKNCCSRNRNGGGNVTKDDINALLDRFQQSLSIDFKRADIKELSEERSLLRDLAREKKAMKKAVAKNKRDLLLKDVLTGASNARAPRPSAPGQVVKIDFGGEQPALPAICPPNPRPAQVITAQALPRQPRHAACTPKIIYH